MHYKLQLVDYSGIFFKANDEQSLRKIKELP